MRVLHLPKWYPHRYDDQDGNFVARHLDAIAHQPAGEAPVQAAVVFATVARGPLARLIELEEDLTGPFPVWRYYYRARLTGWPVLDKPLKLLLWLECQRRGLRALRRHWGGAGPQLVHAHVLLRTGALALWLKGWHRLPYLITEHWTVFLPPNAARLGWLRRQLTRLLVRQAAAYTPVSDDLRRAVQALGGTNPRTVVIPNVVDTHLFHLPPDLAPRRGLLHVAAFNEQAKNLSGILRTLAHLRAHQPTLPLHLRVAGYGPAEPQLRQLAATLGLLADGTVEFVGKLDIEAVAEEMRRAQALVLFSNYENLPCVLIEAQASGLPAIATRVNGVPELLPDDGAAGLLVPPRDEAALARAITTVLQAPPGHFPPAPMRAAAVQRFSYEAVGAVFRRLYREIMG